MQRKQRPQKTHGFTLIEVMISGLLMTIGLFGHITMASSNLDLSRTALYHTQASLLLNQIADSIKSNPSADYAMDSIICATDPCSSNTQLERDINDWNVSLQGFPEGINVSGAINISHKLTDSAMIYYEILITWQRKKSLERGTKNPSITEDHNATLSLGIPTNA